MRSALVAAGIAAAQLADVDAAAQAADDEAADNGAEKIGEQDLERKFHRDAETQGRKTSASIHRTLPPPWRSMTSIGTASTASTDAYRRAYLRVASAWRAVSRHHQDGEVAQVLVPAADFQHVAGECAHFRVIDGEPRRGPRRARRSLDAARGRPRAIASSATTAMRVPTCMSTFVW